jgi:hypothetical protein
MIIHNRARCLTCGDTVESLTRHDFNECSCGNVFVDGGKAYLRAGCRDGWDTFENLSEFADE